MSSKKICCPICNSENISLWGKFQDYEYLSADKTYTYYVCNNCDTIFIESFPIKELNIIYPKNYYSFTSPKNNIAVKVKEYLDKRMFKNILKKFDGKKINILDIGGGSGWLLDLIVSIYSNVGISQIIDIDKGAKRKANKMHRFFHGRVEEFTTDTKYDLILMLNLIEHISDPLGSLIKAQGFLNVGGKILIKTPNVKSLDARIYKKSYWGGLHCPRHWVIFSEKSFKEMLCSTRLKIHRLQYTQGAPFWTWSFLIAGQKRGWFNISKERPVVFHPLAPLLNIFFAVVDFSRNMFGAKTSQIVVELEHK